MHVVTAVLNNLGGSMHNSASGRSVVDALVALNYNGLLDASDRSPNTSAFLFNPDANTNSSGGNEYHHSGGGLAASRQAEALADIRHALANRSGAN